MIKLYLLLFLGLCGFCSLKGQDIHFSQYSAAPLALNPALTGKVYGVFRITLNYRTQWFNIPTYNASAPYQTYQLSFDMPLFRERLGNDGFGIGGMLYSDRAGDGALTTICAMISIAYHKALDRFGKTHLSFGMQAGIVSQQVNLSNLIFGNQLENFGWNPALPNGETNFNNEPSVYPDVNAGVLWTHSPKEKFRYNLGFAMDHLSRPRESFLGVGSNRIDFRYNIHGGMDFFLHSDKSLSISPTFLYMLQGKAQELNAGLGINYWLNDNWAVFGASYYRLSDAFILNGGVEFYNLRIGVSYDINYSNLISASKTIGAFEVSAIYIFKQERPGKIQYENYCPTF